MSKVLSSNAFACCPWASLRYGAFFHAFLCELDRNPEPPVHHGPKHIPLHAGLICVPPETHTLRVPPGTCQIAESPRSLKETFIPPSLPEPGCIPDPDFSSPPPPSHVSWMKFCHFLQQGPSCYSRLAACSPQSAADALRIFSARAGRRLMIVFLAPGFQVGVFGVHKVRAMRAIR